MQTLILAINLGWIPWHPILSVLKILALYFSTFENDKWYKRFAGWYRKLK